MNSKELKAYRIESKWRFSELYAYTLQYNDWLEELQNLTYLSAPEIDGMPRSPNIGDPVSIAAIRQANLASKVATVEKCARLCARDRSTQQAVLKGVTTAGASYDWLRDRGLVYCGKRQYYEARMRYFWYLDKYV